MTKSFMTKHLSTCLLASMIATIGMFPPANAVSPAEETPSKQRIKHPITNLEPRIATRRQSTQTPQGVDSPKNAVPSDDTIKKLTPSSATVEYGDYFTFTVKLFGRPVTATPFRFTMQSVEKDTNIKTVILRENLEVMAGRDQRTYTQETKGETIPGGTLPLGMYLLTVAKPDGTVVKAAVIEIVPRSSMAGEDPAVKRIIPVPAYTPISRVVIIRPPDGISVSSVAPGAPFVYEAETEDPNFQEHDQVYMGKKHNTKVTGELLRSNGTRVGKQWTEPKKLNVNDTLTDFTRYATTDGKAPHSGNKALPSGTYRLRLRREAREENDQFKETFLKIP